MEISVIFTIALIAGGAIGMIKDIRKYGKWKEENDSVDLLWTSLCIKLERCKNVIINDDNSILLSIEGIEYIYLQVEDKVYLNTNASNTYVCDISEVNEYFEGVFTGDYTLIDEVHKHKQAIEELKYGYNDYEYYRGLNSALNLKGSKYDDDFIRYKDFVVILDNNNRNLRVFKIFKRYINSNKFINAEYRLEQTHTIPYNSTNTNNLRNILITS